MKQKSEGSARLCGNAIWQRRSGFNRAAVVAFLGAAVASASMAQGVSRVVNPGATPPSQVVQAGPAPAGALPQTGPTPQYAAQPGPGMQGPLASPAVSAPAAANAAMPTPYVGTAQSVLDRVAPLTPKEIVNLRKSIEERKDAFTENISGAPPARPTSTQTTIDLTPGATPPVLRLALRQGATITFVDLAGRPWPVEASDNFNAEGYKVTGLAEHAFSVGLIKPQIGNVAFKLKDIVRPVMVTVMPAQDATDYNLDLVVPKFVGGVPPTAMASAAPAPSHMSDELMAYLYRSPPRSARRLNVAGSATDEIMAWQISPTSMAVRTSAQVLSPAWIRRQGSTDGVFVYQLPLTPVVVIAQGGELRNVSLSGISVEPAGSGSSTVTGAILSNARLQGYPQ